MLSIELGGGKTKLVGVMRRSWCGPGSGSSQSRTTTTRAALKAFQKDEKIKQTGRMDIETLKRLGIPNFCKDGCRLRFDVSRGIWSALIQADGRGWKRGPARGPCGTRVDLGDCLRRLPDCGMPSGSYVESLSGGWE